MPSRCVRLLLFFVLCVVARDARAGAWLMPEGTGQIILGGAGSIGLRRYDATGRVRPTPVARKAIFSGYLEYGWTPWLTLVAAPTVSRANNLSANNVTGSDSSAFGARLRLAETGTRVISLQVLVQPPLLPGDRATRLASGGARDLAVDARVQFGQSFRLFGLPFFVDVAPGARVRADPFPTEARLDLTAGVQANQRLLILFQDFFSFAGSAGPQLQRTSTDKLQGSLVYAVTQRCSVQLGGFRTIAGVNAIREVGPFGALWVRF